MTVLSAALACTASALAGGAGYSAWRWMEQKHRRARHRSAVRNEGSGLGGNGTVLETSVDRRMIRFLEHESLVAHSGNSTHRPPAPLMSSPWFAAHAPFAGLAGQVNVEGFCVARAKLALAGAGTGAALGLVFSGGLALVLGVVGAFLGATAPKRAVKHRIDARTRQMEWHLPEMLDVVAIGMRSGLSFDRSLQIYVDRFPTCLAQEFSRAQREWTSGLERRDEALRALATTYDSPVFARVMESVIRCMRFGTSMVEGLEAAACEARVAYKSARQEQVAKAPVKMMIPTGTLILPAMLIMVMGPVLLELIGGGL